MSRANVSVRQSRRDRLEVSFRGRHSQHDPLTPSPFSAELNQLTGIAAILTYPLDIEVVEEEERVEKEEKEKTGARDGSPEDA